MLCESNFDSVQEVDTTLHIQAHQMCTSYCEVCLLRCPGQLLVFWVACIQQCMATQAMGCLHSNVIATAYTSALPCDTQPTQCTHHHLPVVVRLQMHVDPISVHQAAKSYDCLFSWQDVTVTMATQQRCKCLQQPVSHSATVLWQALHAGLCAT